MNKTSALVNTTIAEMTEIKDGDTFVYNGTEHIADGDAHLSGDASCDEYIVYDTDGESFFQFEFPNVAGRWKIGQDGRPYCFSCKTPQDKMSNYCPHCGASLSAPDGNDVQQRYRNQRSHLRHRNQRSHFLNTKTDDSAAQWAPVPEGYTLTEKR